MYELAIHRDAKADLERLWESDKEAAAFVQVTLEEVGADQYYLASLSDDGFEDEKIEVTTYRWMQRRGFNFWRLKLFEFDLSSGPFPYRIIYAFDGPKRIYYVLAIMHRDQDYETDGDLSTRLQKSYDELGIARIPRG